MILIRSGKYIYFCVAYFYLFTDVFLYDFNFTHIHHIPTFHDGTTECKLLFDVELTVLFCDCDVITADCPMLNSRASTFGQKISKRTERSLIKMMAIRMK